LSGYTPFYGDDQQELFDSIMKGQYEFDEEYWCNISDEGNTEGVIYNIIDNLTQHVYIIAKNMINRLLTFDPKKRATAEEALKDPWITSEENSGINLAPNVRKGFNSRRTLKSIVTAVAAINRLKINEYHSPSINEEKEEKEEEFHLDEPLKAADN
jgi:calcium/calmodulin-dependent protein kinase I